jgi:hypothetical protein
MDGAVEATSPICETFLDQACFEISGELTQFPAAATSLMLFEKVEEETASMLRFSRTEQKLTDIRFF